MARSNKPIVWSLFAAGGTFAAFVTPAMIVVTGLALSFGLLPPEALSYERLSGLIENPIAKGIVFLTVFLPAWHAAHRLRITAHDFGIREDGLVMMVCYGLASVATVMAVYALLSL
ncbi:MAG: fumarate reductase subunit D [Rhodospirillaceae bacterium]|nr:fumarate reductase subunit D [Rhodospirillaceae bacterium]MBL6930069.1 fumarate reductase subunit D [Rhodospirillales bacterium]